MDARCPILQLLIDLREHGKPQLAWVVRWGKGGKIDPVAGAWQRAKFWDSMVDLLKIVGREEQANRLINVTLEMSLLRTGRGTGTDRNLTPVLRLLAPPTLDEVIAGYAEHREEPMP